MNVLKNMDTLFLVAVAAAISATALSRSTGATPEAPALADTQMIKVVLIAKRMTAAEKTHLAG